MRVAMVSAINFMSENNCQKLNNNKINLVNVNKDRIPYNYIENIVNTQDLTLKISKESTNIGSEQFNVFTLIGTKKYPALGKDLTSKTIFRISSDSGNNEIHQKITKALGKIIDGLNGKCSSVLSAMYKIGVSCK